MSVHQFTVKKANGKEVPLSSFKGNVLLIVNTASKCQFTYQFEQLQELYDKYREKGFEILGFPCGQFDEQEMKTSDEAAQFCRANYGVTFSMFEKISVNGAEEEPLFTYLKENAPFAGFDEGDMTQKLLKMRLESNYPHWVVGDAIKWNFTKFLVDQNGQVIGRFEPFEEPLTFEKEIEKLLAS